MGKKAKLPYFCTYCGVSNHCLIMKCCCDLVVCVCVCRVLVEKRSDEQDVKLLRNARKAGGGGSLSDDEPLYDSVCSDEDYASIGDNQSVKEESTASKTQVSSSKETIDTMVLSSLCQSLCQQ